MTDEGAEISSPYKGLAAFEDTELDALLFFGRERDTDTIAANVMASRFTVLYGPLGVGKSSVLRAGVVRKLRAVASDAESSSTIPGPTIRREGSSLQLRSSSASSPRTASSRSRTGLPRR